MTNDVAYDTIKNSVVDLLHYFVIEWKVFEQPVNILFAPQIINAGIILFKQKKEKRRIAQRITRIIISGKSKFMYKVQDEVNVCLGAE